MNEDGTIEPQKLAMTAPVRTEQSQKLAMASPVRTELLGKLRNMKVSFVMPRKVQYSGYIFIYIEREREKRETQLY